MERKRLKIGMFIDSFYPEIDGVVMVSDYLASALAEFNDVTVVVPDMGTGKKYDRPYEIVELKSLGVPLSNYRAGFLFSWQKAYKELLKKHFDVIHIHSTFTVGKVGMSIGRKQHIPVFVTAHSRYYIETKKILKFDLPSKLVMRYMIGEFNAADKLVVVNDPLGEELREQGCKNEPIVLYNGTGMTPPKDREKSIRKVNRLFGLKEDDTVLLFVGRISTVKNIFFILDSLKLLKEDGVSFKMLYVGAGPDKKLLRAKIREYGMEDCVLTPGRIGDRELLSAVYARSDLFLFPSIYEPFGLVKAEAAVNETPGIYIADTMAASDVTDNVNGFLSVLDTAAFKDRIKGVLSDRELLNRVAAKAKETMYTSWRTVAENHCDEYIKAIREKKLSRKSKAE